LAREKSVSEIQPQHANRMSMLLLITFLPLFLHLAI
jgi:hypothetical protein